MRFGWVVAAFAAVLLVAPFAAAQQTDMPLRVTPGSVYTVTIEQTQSMGEGAAAVTITANQVYALEILAADRWRYTPVSLSYSDLPGFGGEGEPGAGMDVGLLNDGLSAMVRATMDVGFECRVDAYGRCLELTNWPLWRDRLENLVMMVDAFARMIPETEVAAERPRPRKGEPVEAWTEQTSASPSWRTLREPILIGFASLLDGINDEDAALMMSTFHPAAAVQGRSLRRGAAEAFTEEWDMPFGASAIRVTGEVQLNSVDTRARTASVTRTAVLDTASATAAIGGMSSFVISSVLEPMAPVMAAQGSEMPDAASMRAMVDAIVPGLALSMEETTRGTIDLDTGLARETVTDLRLTMAPPTGEPSAPIETTMHYVLRISPGAPEAPRLPRAP